ncbi:MAG TPA: hypothetical protein VMT20_24335 [Terriglobia bacterium]|nr:hypothetical protein [Terriglobia bacterium]
MPSESKNNRPRRLLKWVTLIVACLATLAVLAAVLLHWYSPLNRNWVKRTLEKRYEANVELKMFNASFYPSVSITGAGLVLRRKDQPGLPPFASIARFSISARWAGLLMHPLRFRDVRLEGLVLNVPPRRTSPESKKKSNKSKRSISPFLLENVVADGTTLNILSSNPNKPPHVFEIQKLRLQSAGVGQAMSFQADLLNPVPVGEVHSTGRFGPFDTDEPSQTPVGGTYTFSDADLSTIHGLRGILSSQGTYDGVLSNIQVDGATDTPDFGLSASGNTVPLKTQFTAVVDGTSGDTFLRPVTAQLGSSTIVARGGVARASRSAGRIIKLDVTAKPARLEDLLRLAVKSPKPVMTGAVAVQTHLEIRPGKEDILQRLTLDGTTFDIESAHFTDPEIEGKITSLSRLGQGKRGDASIQNAPINMQGKLVLANELANFSNLTFGVPGAKIQVHGTYGLATQALNFEGTASLEAKASQLTTGIKSVLLKAVDPLLERDGAGIVVPIKITGTRQEPSIKVEFGKILSRHE